MFFFSQSSTAGEKRSASDEKRSAGPAFPYKYAGMPSTTRAPIFYKRNTPQAMTEAQSLPLGVPAFKPIKTSATTNIQSMLRKTSELVATRKGALHQYPAPNLSAANLTFIQSQLALPNAGPSKMNPMVISPQANAFKVPVPAFQALPSSVLRGPSGQIVHADKDIRKSSTPGIEHYSTIHRIDVRLYINSLHVFKQLNMLLLSYRQSIERRIILTRWTARRRSLRNHCHRSIWKVTQSRSWRL